MDDDEMAIEYEACLLDRALTLEEEKEVVSRRKTAKRKAKEAERVRRILQQHCEESSRIERENACRHARRRAREEQRLLPDAADCVPPVMSWSLFQGIEDMNHAKTLWQHMSLVQSWLL
jgi:hypothetical protein